MMQNLQTDFGVERMVVECVKKYNLIIKNKIY